MDEINELIDCYIQDLEELKKRDTTVEIKVEALNLLGVDLVKENSYNLK